MRQRARILALAAALAALGWNPLVPRFDAPYRWSTAGPVVWNPDGGTLGNQSNAQAIALTALAFSGWQEVPSAALAYVQGAQIVDGAGVAVDVTRANYAEVIALDDGQNPVIYDNDRDIFSALGLSVGVIGFAGVLRAEGATITKGYVALQGDFVDGDPGDGREMTPTQFVGIIVHEVGHFSGLGHTKVNAGVPGPAGCPAAVLTQWETMSPFAHFDMASLHRDEVVGLSALYPEPGFAEATAGIAGRLLDRDGVSPFDGGFLVLRPDDPDCDAAYQGAQGIQSGSNPAASGGPGSYRFVGLAPDSGYTLRAFAVSDGGSYPIGGSAPPPLGGPAEFYNGADEDSFDPPDAPDARTTIVSGPAGSTLPGVDIAINNPGGPGEISPTGPAALRVARLDGATALPAEVLGLDDGFVDGAEGAPGPDLLAWVNRITPRPDQLPFRLERIDLLFPHASVAVGRAIRLLVYTDPSGGGDPAGATLALVQDATVQRVSASTFDEHLLTEPVLVTAGDVYVGAIDATADAAASQIAGWDTTPSGRAFVQRNGTSPSGLALCGPATPTCADRTWMVRAVGSPVPPAGTIELSWGVPCNAAAVPGQDTVVYQGTLATVGGVEDHEPIACTTQGRLRVAVPEPGTDAYWLVVPRVADREGDPGRGSDGRPRVPRSTCFASAPDGCP